MPKVLDTAVYDEIIPVENENASQRAVRSRAKRAYWWASPPRRRMGSFELAKRPENAGKTIVALLPDTGERYLSTALFAE